MVRQTSLLKSRTDPKVEPVSLSDDERTYDHGKRPGQSMFLQSEDLSRLLDAPVPDRTVRTAANTEVFERKRNSADSAETPVRKVVPSVGAEPTSWRTSFLADGAGNSDAGPEGVESGVDDALSTYRKEATLVDTAYIEMLDVIEEVYGRRYVDRERVIGNIVNAVTRLVDIGRDSNAMLRKAIRLKRSASSLAEHSLNTAILSIKIGKVRGFSRERLFSLALSAFLGDLGMTAVDSAILSKSERLTPGELDEIKRHVQYSREILEKEFPEFPFLPAVAFQIHEREDGSGYPRGLRGDNIHEFAKIIGLSDVYIAMTSRKAHREDFSGYSTLQQIISRRGIDFSSQIIKSLIDVISVFPLESLVRLNNGAIGRIIDISQKHPTRPKLSILINSDGERLHVPKYLDLEQEPLLYVETPDIEEGVIL